MPNATGKENYKFSQEEINKLRIETTNERFPSWVPRGLQEQIDNADS